MMQLNDFSRGILFPRSGKRREDRSGSVRDSRDIIAMVLMRAASQVVVPPELMGRLSFFVTTMLSVSGKFSR
jgi:hypothetical protein